MLRDFYVCNLRGFCCEGSSKCFFLFFCSDPNLTDDRTRLHLPCVGSYGHAVNPSQVLGGYDRNNFTDASLLFVTFAIKKNLNEVEIEKAKAWQEKFVEYVKNYDDFELQVAYVPIDLPDPITKF